MIKFLKTLITGEPTPRWKIVPVEGGYRLAEWQPVIAGLWAYVYISDTVYQGTEATDAAIEHLSKDPEFRS